VPTWAGFLFLAVVLDVFSRRIVGWAMANHLRTELILDALDMAVARRRPQGVIHHSDQGCQGGFKRSSQHLTRGSCDDDAKAAMFRSIWARQVAIARPTLGGTE
jgi:transposase InsO family protein